MQPFKPRASFLMLVSLPVLAAHAHEKLSPHQRAILEAQSPPPGDARFSFDFPAGHTKPDASSQSPMLGLDGTKDITLDGQRLRDAPKRNSESKTK